MEVSENTETQKGIQVIDRRRKLPPILSLMLNDSSVLTDMGHTPYEDETESEENRLSDMPVRLEWGGQCNAKDWNYCNQIKRISVMNVLVKEKDP